MLACWVPLNGQTPPKQEKLEPPKISITVTAIVSAEAPASMSILDKKQIEENPGVNVDDRLRNVPGFSLFRRSSSLVANPTTQGISLRGLGSSGASRSLVLWDGIPANDPFGGWVYWTRFAPDELERIEISRGASTSLFGDRAMSGAIALFTKPVLKRRFSGGYEGGNRKTHQLTGGAATIVGNWAFSAKLRAFTTDGYFIIPQLRRGTADTMAGVRFVAGDTRADYTSGKTRAFFKFDVLAEQRQNGTALTQNSTGEGTMAAHVNHQFGTDSLTVLAYHTREQYHASFSTVTNNRNTERISSWQTVPVEATGGAGMYHFARSGWNALAGGDFQRIEGESRDVLVPPGQRVGGGSQFQRGAFVQTDFKIGPLKLFAGGRGHSTGVNNFFNPSAGWAYGRKSWRGRGSVYRSFRAPTLNELYREFRQGNAVTRANALLQPESAFGAELGVDYIGELGRFSATVFRTSIDKIVTNVTISSTPSLVDRQRQNAASALSKGFEAQYGYQWKSLRGEMAYLYADGRFANNFRLPQVPRHQGSASLTWSRKLTTLSAGVRSFSKQFEDDVNAFLLPGFATLQATARHQLTPSLSAVLSLENILDRQYVVGFSPTALIGSPFMWRGGLRWDGVFRK